MTTLFDATLALAKILPWQVIEHTASADGAAGKTTLVCTTLPWYVTVGATNTIPPDDFYNGGTLWFISCTNTTNNSDTAVITDWANSTGTFTFAAADAQLKSGDSFAVAPREYPRWILRRAINQALADIGGELLYNVATTTVADQMTYDLPASVYNIKTVEIASSLTSPYGYVEHHHWQEVNDDIYFEEGTQPGTTGYIIRLGYQVPLAELTTDAATLPDQYNKEMVVWSAAVHALRWKIGLTHDDNPWLKERYAEAMAMSLRYQNMHMRNITRKPRAHQYSVYSLSTADASTDPDPGTVRLS